MKKKIKYIILIIIFIIVLANIFAMLDYSKIKKDHKPVLSIYAGKHKTTKADMYYGLGYTIVKCPGKDNIKPIYKLVVLSNNHVCYAGHTPIIKVD